MKSYFKKIIIIFSWYFVAINIQGYAVDRPAKKIVFVNMVADLFHAGHVAFLKMAKQHGDILIVGLHSDEVASNYKRKPICNIEERKTVVESCKYVNKVISNTPLVIDQNFIDKYKISMVVHGDDFDEEKINKFYGDIIKLDKFISVPYTQGISTSEIINRIQNYVSKQIDEELFSIIKDLESL